MINQAQPVRPGRDDNEDYTMPPDVAGWTGAPGEECPAHEPAIPGFTGKSASMEYIYARIRAAARSNATVFITGESGTGKEVCAQAIHRLSPRSRGPFIPVNCAAIPRELLESELFGHVKGAFTGAIADRNGAVRLADGGTLFLDEIAEMPTDLQTKLLRFLQDLSFRRVGGSALESTDIRILCATNRNPRAEVAAGRLREDLFYRLHVLPLQMPPLRERGADIELLAQHLLARYSTEERKRFEKFSPTAALALRRYCWPGNIRELQNVVRHIVVMHDGSCVEDGMLPPVLRESGDAGLQKPAAPTCDGYAAIRPLAAAERDLIEHAIALCNGNIPRAAAALHVSPSTIYRKKAAWDKEARRTSIPARRSEGSARFFT